VVVVRLSSDIEGCGICDVPLVGEDMELRFGSEGLFRACGIDVEALRSSLACNLLDHSAAFSLIPDRILGTRIFLAQVCQLESGSSDGGVFCMLPISNSSSNIRLPRMADL